MVLGPTKESEEVLKPQWGTTGWAFQNELGCSKGFRSHPTDVLYQPYQQNTTAETMIKEILEQQRASFGSYSTSLAATITRKNYHQNQRDAAKRDRTSRYLERPTMKEEYW